MLSFLRFFASLPCPTFLNIYIRFSLAFEFSKKNTNMKNVGETKEASNLWKLKCVCLSDKNPSWVHYKPMYPIKVSQADFVWPFWKYDRPKWDSFSLFGFIFGKQRIDMNYKSKFKKNSTQRKCSGIVGYEQLKTSKSSNAL